jgi:predicted transcriptional regulator
VKVRVEGEDAYWREQARRLKSVERAWARGKPARVSGDELVFTSLTEMARALTPKRLELLRLVRRRSPSSVRQLAELAGRDIKNVVADVKALEAYGLLEMDGEARPNRPKALRAAFERIEVHVDL